MTKRKRLPPPLKWVLWILSAVSSLFLLIVGILYSKQDIIVQQAIDYANESFAGRISLEGSHISPFANFPYVSVDLEGVKLYETKADTLTPLMDVADLYVGFNVWAAIQGNYQVKAISMREGYVKVTQHVDGKFNLLEALSSPDSALQDTAAAAPLQLDVRWIKLREIDLHKINESTDTDIDAFISQADIRVTVQGAHTKLDLVAAYEMSLILSGDTSYLNHKHIELETKLDYNAESSQLVIAPSILDLEGSSFQAEGRFELADDPYIDLQLAGTKPNFDMLIAFAPDDLIPTLRSYENEGEVFFEAEVSGSLADGALPHIDARFGCAEGIIKNNQTARTLQDLAFNGYLRTGTPATLANMEFGLQDFRAKPETGQFEGALTVKNFDTPDIDLQLRSEFDLNFLVDFFQLEGLSDLSGSVNLTMNFHDIIDLDEPEKSIERLNESYFTEIEIRDLSFKSEAFYLPIENLNVIGHIEGHEAFIDTLMGKVGNSDLFVSARISDLPAIIHHTKDSVWVDMKMKADLLDIAELSFNDSLQAAALDEQIRDFQLDMGFSSSAFAFTESPHLPVGEFFIYEFNAQPEHYPHKIHDFQADLFIEEEDLRVIDFSGELDSSDFHFNGRLTKYYRWMESTLAGDTELEFDFTSRRLRLEDLFAYRGENYVPEDYRHENIRNLAMHGRTELHFRENELQSIDMYLDKWAAKMELHDADFEDFRGRVHYEDEHLTAENFQGRIGRSDFAMDLYWYLGADPALRKADHRIALRADRLDLNQLLAWNLPPANPAQDAAENPVEHDTAFGIFDLPFWDMNVQADIGWLSYHTYQILDLQASLRMLKERYVHLDQCDMKIAGGTMNLTGYFDARDSTHIYFAPTLQADGIDLDQFMVKFENFGQDYLVSDNLHGFADCDLTGRVRIHKDMTPMIEASELEIALEIHEGRLDNYEPMLYLADYFANSNLSRIRFDTLRNTFTLKDNVFNIPRMTVNSSLGFMELWGSQDLGERFETDMTLKIPLSLVSDAAFSKLFKRKPDEIDPEQEDAIVYQQEDKRVPYTYVRLLSDVDDYDVQLMKKGE